MSLFLGSGVYAKPLLILDEVKALQSLEAQGLGLSQILGVGQSANNRTLKGNKGYRSFVDRLAGDLDELQAGDKYLSVTMAKKHRLFDKRWLWSRHSYYELVGLVTRFDRGIFSTNERFKCGEARLIYRLAYRKTQHNEKLYSRLPLTINLVFWLVDRNGQGGKSQCLNIAKAWQLRGGPQQTAQRNVHQFSLQYLKSLELNLQAVRWPSTVRPDFGGYAEYILRVFHFDHLKGIFEPAPMENMIDVAALKSNPRLKRELKDYLNRPGNFLKLESGIGTLPEKFLAKKAISVAFHGIARKANRPFDQVFRATDFSNINYSKGQFVKTPAAYLRRLNDMSCVGCHQSRAVAGFHFVGVDRQETFAANAVKMARSGHLQLDLVRRQKYYEGLIAGRTPDEARGFSERLESEKGGYGTHCSLGKDPSFRKWTCVSGLSCQSIDTATTNALVGVCLPGKNKFAGDPCDVGRVSQHSDPRRDRVIRKVERSCRSGQSCFRASDGFPGGLCHEWCDNLIPGEACGLIAFDGFNSCLGANKPFTTCLKQYTGDISLKACGLGMPCRDDFVCARSKNNRGVCIPPYFLFQLRVDGHPRPS